MTSTTQALLDLLGQAREADLLSRIEWRDPIAAFGTEAVQAIRPWLADPATASFAVRVIERAAAKNASAKELAIEALRAVHGGLFAEPARRDAADALGRLGSRSRPDQKPRVRARPSPADPIPALIRGYLYTRRELRSASLLGNLYSGISYPAV
ncbi:MAG TPA: hypothetical protein VE011_01615, partial [Candidatus Dormibacteraeota bacterium]|nr:hypothetical protein [Candidatus Dormibacteraeota bacterium]